MFKKLKKKTIQAVATLDLRQYTPKALEGIDKIRAVTTIILPENPSAEFIEAYSKINKSAVANELHLPASGKICTVNGSAVINNETVSHDSIYMVNGLVLIGNIDESKRANFIVNGMLVKKKGSAVNIISANGAVVEADFDEHNIKMFDSQINIDMNFIRCVEKGVRIISDGKMFIEKNVTEEAIIEKDIYFIADSKVICCKEIMGCVLSRGIFDSKVMTYEEYESFEAEHRKRRK